MRFKKLPVAGLALAVGLAACSDSTGPNDDFDPSESAADFAAVDDAFNTDVYNSLSAMGEGFGSVTQAPALAVELVEAGRLSVTSPDTWQQRGEAIADLLASSAAQVILIPESFRGRTYEYSATAGWYYNAARTGAPENGIRFILYAIDPVTHEPTDMEIGYADVKDESTDTEAIVRLQVFSGQDEYVNYTVKASGLVGSLSVEIAGSVTDGTTQVDFTLNHSFEATFASARAEFDYVIEVPSREFTVDATMVIEVDAGTQSASITVEASFRQGSNTVAIAGTIDSQTDGGTLEVTVNEAPFATITITRQSITVTPAEGELTAAHIQAFQDIAEALHDLFDDAFDNLFNPVSWLFEFGGV
jgi:hypothetical protein